MIKNTTGKNFELDKSKLKITSDDEWVHPPPLTLDLACRVYRAVLQLADVDHRDHHLH